MSHSSYKVLDNKYFYIDKATMQRLSSKSEIRDKYPAGLYFDLKRIRKEHKFFLEIVIFNSTDEDNFIIGDSVRCI